jgi:hypothetical protein
MNRIDFAFESGDDTLLHELLAEIPCCAPVKERDGSLTSSYVLGFQGTQGELRLLEGEFTSEEETKVRAAVRRASSAKAQKTRAARDASDPIRTSIERVEAAETIEELRAAVADHLRATHGLPKEEK